MVLRMTGVEPDRAILVLGAGITGLTAASELSRVFPGRVVLLEKDAEVGGLAATSSAGQFTFDVGSHRLHDNYYPAVDQLIRDLCGTDLLRRDRKGLIFINNRPLRYPPTAIDILSAFGLKSFMRLGLSLLSARMGRLTRRGEADNFEDYTTSIVGRELYELFYRPYARKLYGISPRAIAKDPALSRVRKFSLRVVLRDLWKGVFGKKKATYLYPARGIGQLSTALKERFLANGGRLHFISRLDGLKVREDRAIESVAFRTRDGATQELATDTVVSTISLDALHDLVRLESDGGGPPAFDLRWRGLRILYLATSDKVPAEQETFYFPESHIPFGRVSELNKYSPALNADPNTSLLTIEVPCTPGDEMWAMEDDRLAELCVAGLQKLGILRTPARGVTTVFSRKLEKVYPVYDLGWKERFDVIYNRLSKLHNLYTIGRGALFLHCNIDHCMLMAIKLAKHLEHNHGDKAKWEPIRQDFFDYRVRE
jgi:protoporphyrinogen oxidase